MKIAIVTSRPRSMLMETSNWLCVHFPELFAIAELHMRATEEASADFDVARRDKAQVIANIVHGETCCIVDDDVDLYSALEQAGVNVDSFVAAPEGWHQLFVILSDAPAWLIIDIDSTLAQSPPVDKGDLVLWRRAIIESPPSPIMAAQDAINRLLGKCRKQLLPKGSSF